MGLSTQLSKRLDDLMTGGAVLSEEEVDRIMQEAARQRQETENAQKQTNGTWSNRAIKGVGELRHDSAEISRLQQSTADSREAKKQWLGQSGYRLATGQTMPERAMANEASETALSRFNRGEGPVSAQPWDKSLRKENTVQIPSGKTPTSGSSSPLRLDGRVFANRESEIGENGQRARAYLGKSLPGGFGQENPLTAFFDAFFHKNYWGGRRGLSQNSLPKGTEDRLFPAYIGRHIYYSGANDARTDTPEMLAKPAGMGDNGSEQLARSETQGQEQDYARRIDRALERALEEGKEVYSTGGDFYLYTPAASANSFGSARRLVPELESLGIGAFVSDREIETSDGRVITPSPSGFTVLPDGTVAIGSHVRGNAKSLAGQALYKSSWISGMAAEFLSVVQENLEADSPQFMVWNQETFGELASKDQVYRSTLSSLAAAVSGELNAGRTGTEYGSMFKDWDAVVSAWERMRDKTAVSDFEGVMSREELEETLDRLQMAIDVVGLIPGVGEPADGLNALISLDRGRYIDAALSAGSMLPIAGWLGTGAKHLIRLLKKGDAATPAAKQLTKLLGKLGIDVDEAMGITGKYGDEAAEATSEAARHADEAAEAVGDAARQTDELAEAAGEAAAKGAGNAGKLDWDSVVSKKGETRLDHINRHSTPNSSRATHGVFNSDPQNVVNQAWNNKGRVAPIKDGMGGEIYNIPMKNAGYESGYNNTGAAMDYVTIVVKEGTSELIAAFPSFGNYGY